MAGHNKLGKRTDLRLAILRGQVTSFLWNGRLETTLDRAQEVQKLAEKYITLAVRTYNDNVEVTKTVVNSKGEKEEKKVLNDGAKKLNARRTIMANTYDVQEMRADGEKKADFVARTEDIKNPLLEKIFNVYAPRFVARKEKTGQGGGYSRIVKLGFRRGDAAEMAVLELLND